ncbi:MAG TPA: recombination mediator RecR [bacterium]|nr:recombination mediator RecR [bacterium]
MRALQTLPEVGPKMAQRIAFHILMLEKPELEKLLSDVEQGYLHTMFCETCGNFSESSVCIICSDPARDRKKICVVTEPQDIASIEKIRTFKGTYHVLGGLIDPLEGIGPEHLHIARLEERAQNEEVAEIILALSPNVLGETTSIYLKRHLKERFPSLRITRLARGIPMGTALEYADEITLKEALEERKEL